MIGILLALSSSILFTLSFPPFDFSFLAWISLVPFFLAIKNRPFKTLVGLSYLNGAVFYLGAFSWINSIVTVNFIHYLILGLFLGLYHLLFGLLLFISSKRIRFPLVMIAPAAWVTVEFIRAHAGFLSLPMGFIGYTQYKSLGLIQTASVTGSFGISFLVVLFNSAFADLLIGLLFRRKDSPILSLYYGIRRPILLAGSVSVLIASLWFIGWLAIPSNTDGKSLRISVIQGNIPQDKKWKREYRQWIFSRYESLSQEAAASSPDLIIWPEASTPGLVLNDMNLFRKMGSLVRGTRAYFLVGSAEYPKFSIAGLRSKKSGNMAIFFSPNGDIIGQYLKTHLVPFAEYVPYQGVVPWPKIFVKHINTAHVAGRDATIFKIKNIGFGTLICSEMIFSGLCREMVNNGADFLVNISNESWFGKSSFVRQFFAVCVFIAVENRVPVVRCTNSGFSCFIDPYGRMTAKLSKGEEDLFIEGTLTREVTVTSYKTPYTKLGDLLAYACILFTAVLMIWAGIQRKLIKKSKD